MEPNMAFVYQHSDWSDEARVRYKLGKAFDPVWKMQQSVSPTKSIALDSTLYAAPYPMNLKAFWLYHLWPRAVAWETGEVKVRLMHDSLQFFPNTP